jgi:hypothetical protein
VASRLVSSPSPHLSSGAGLDGLSDANALTLAGLAVGAVTAGGAAFVAAAVVPGHVVGGSLLTATCLVGGHVKKTTGSYLPFLQKDEDKAPVSDTPVTATA